MVDKRLFLHDLAAVSFLRNGEAKYLPEWLDYHLAAGVEHFYLYDNAPVDETKELLKPYFDAEQVDYFAVPGELMQIPAYNDAARRFRFTCRYLAFLDADEFLFPKTEQSVAEIVDEILSRDDRAAALVVNEQVFGSDGQETADLSRGVLDRFTRRAPRDWFIAQAEGVQPAGNVFVRTIANPRYIRYIVNPHFAYFFDGKFAVNSAGGRVPLWGNEPVLSDKIVVNRYIKSKEEFLEKVGDEQLFAKLDRNDEVDDDIHLYRELRAEGYTPPKKFEREDYFRTLEGILLPAVRSDVPQEFFDGKLEMFLTCRSLAGILKRRYPKDNRGKFMEEAALRAVHRTHFSRMTYAETMLMINSLPPILALPYPVVEDIRQNCMSFVRQIMNDLKRTMRWDAFIELGNYLDLLSAFGARVPQPQRNA